MSFTDINGTHFPDFPPLREMNFSHHCSAWGEWFATYLSLNPLNSTQFLDGDVRTIIKLFDSSVPLNWSMPGDWTRADYKSHVLEWYGFNYYYYNYSTGLYDMNEDFEEYVLDRPAKHCEIEKCIAYGWSGDMDLIGIGVFTSYYVEAVLVTILLFTYSYWRFRQSSPSYKNPVSDRSKLRVADRFIVGLQESSQDFLDASELFSIAMLVAALYISGTGITQRQKTSDSSSMLPHQKTALYDMLLSMLASTFSIFPVLVACTIKRRDPSNSINRKRRPIWLGIAILTLMWMLSVTEAFMSLYGNLDYEVHEELEGLSAYNDWAGMICDWRRSAHYWVGMKVAQYLLLACPLILVIVTVFLITGFGYPGVVDKPLVVHCRHLWRLVVAWICLLAMWGILGFFTWVRHKIDVTVGHLNESNDWRFGQWLALFTWIPFVRHVLTKWISGTNAEHQQREQTQNELRRGSDGTSVSKQTHGSSPLADLFSYAAIPAHGRVLPMENLSTDPTLPLNHEYSYGSLKSTESRRDPMEEWQATGW